MIDDFVLEEKEEEVFSDDSEEVDAVSIHRQRMMDIILTNISRYFEENDVKLNDVFKKVKKMTEKNFILAIGGAAQSKSGEGRELDLTEGE